MPKRYLTGGGNSSKNKEKSNKYLFKSFHFVKFCIQTIISAIRNKLLDRYLANDSHRYNRLFENLTSMVYDKIEGAGVRAARSIWNLHIRHILYGFDLLNSKGTILIEFAVCMPVLIILLFYINDLMKMKRYYSQTEFVAQQMVNIIQNISQKRTDKRITALDLQYAAALAWLTVYPGTTMYTGQSGNAIVNASPWIYLYYVRGTSGNQVSSLWGKQLDCRDWTAPLWRQGVFSENSSHRGVKWGTNVDPAYIYSALKIKQGEYKLIIENTFNWNTTFAYANRRAFHLRLIDPKGNSPYILFPSVVIFTPKPGLFSETAPS